MSEASNNKPGRIMAFKQGVEKRLGRLHEFVCNVWKLAKDDDAFAKTPGITYAADFPRHSRCLFGYFLMVYCNRILQISFTAHSQYG